MFGFGLSHWGSFWQKDKLLQYTMTLLQGPKDPVLPTLTYVQFITYVNVLLVGGNTFTNVYNGPTFPPCGTLKLFQIPSSSPQSNWFTLPKAEIFSGKNGRALVSMVLYLRE